MGTFIEEDATRAHESTRIRTLPVFYEDWKRFGVDTEKWQTSVVGTGRATGPEGIAAAGMPKAYMLATGATASSIDRLESRYKEFNGRDQQTAFMTIIKQTTLEFEGTIAAGGGGLELQENTVSFWGLSHIQGATRATTNIFGFALLADALSLISDNEGVETAVVPTDTIDVTIVHKWGITLDRVGRLRFYVDDVLEGTITTNITLRLDMHVVFCVGNEAAAPGNATTRLGAIRVYHQDVL